MLKYKKGDKVIISKYYVHSFDPKTMAVHVKNRLVTINNIIDPESANPYLINYDSQNIGWCSDECILGLEGESIEEVKETCEHIVQLGDTLFKIAKAYHTTYDRIAKDNNISNLNKLVVGQKLIIKPIFK